ncbi:rho guanine nucleotide exchange factor 16 isoform X1 [Fukomys damarensis]|uniref:rho guanine nucleotide exchange factor 16 isoform X1 n=1 Tax=Fukomys damarensis TaxID=885580 RepID=UPI00053FA94C|nr:rho guanine nucleotide exchange factor 16 isoform X1 [Fukomys damarensis]XP_010626092.1 rho guanine nucleotide exchange factor 16 isoform X1 [Fukomys damarensis]XP_010626093.1 rho guanine nucleotide exchange factor 16 isoform X1 [Fukomys damarensis]XP_010626094.1 rho guanine nucleotide exchange factor 16 isoform X1 [Fukomys damarensis]XP_010626095.1 rho guanine nucleotide exchange factor 16 isoform X1 [Fukomys damarensis]XP_010626096.1 rho guanine nucleotide exchange factor 16 isoform X1 [F
MSQRHSDSSLEERLLEYRFHSELQLDANGNPSSKLPIVRGSLQSRTNAAFEPEALAPPQPPSEDQEPRAIVLSTQSPAALKMGTQQLIPRSLAVASKAKTPTRHQSFGAAVLSKEAARRDPQLLSSPSFSLDDMDMDLGPGGTLKRNLRTQSYRAAMKGLGSPRSKGDSSQLSPKLQALAEEPSQPATQCPTKNKRTLGRKRAHKGSFKDDPGFYQEIRERGLNTSHESDDDMLDEPPGPEGTRRVDTSIVVKSYRPVQVIWSQLPEVVESGVLEKLCTEERKRQEAIFEILTSEFSYLHSLGVLVAEFLQSRELRTSMTQMEHHHLFSNIQDVLAASRRFFEALEQRHQAQVCVEDISDILEEHAERHFHPYVVYCSNEVYQQRTLQRLMNSNAAFREALRDIEKRPACGGLPMISFLILPMQRVTRLPLLTDTLCLKSQGHPERYKAASQALKAISKLVRQCNEGAHTMERTEQMYTLHTQLDFSKVKSFPLISASRWLLKRGELFLEEAGLFKKIASRPTCYLFLFNDVLIITKKKSEDSYAVQDYSQLDHIQVQKLEPSEPSLSGGGSRSSSVPHPFRVTLLRNSEARQEQVLLSSDSASDRARWITALTYKEKQWQDRTNKGELPQVEVTKAYIAKQADELTLQQADVVLVRAEEDGWLHGERLRDGEMGWFPEDVARRITSPVAVEGNVRRMERLRVETNV